MLSAQASDGDLSDDAYLLALLHLEKLGPARLAALRAHGSYRSAWEGLRRGEIEKEVQLPGVGGSRDALLDEWRRQSQTVDPRHCLVAQRESGHTMFRHGSDSFPERLADDPEPPEFLFVRGELPGAEVPTVAVVGTRRCSANGNRVAERFGFDLATAGVCVVSGLAMGIDAAAHRGALRASGGAPPVGVVATGLDLHYPRATTSLADQVALAGAVISEYPLGTQSTPWRFPARNRIVAGLADAVVVVESARTGGSMHTVDEALCRDVPVFALPGPVGAASSEGTNALLFDGGGLVRNARDVLEYLGLFAPSHAINNGDAITGSAVAPPIEHSRTADPLLEAVEWWPTSIDDLCRRTGLALGELSVRLEALTRSGHIVSHGSSFERRR